MGWPGAGASVAEGWPRNHPLSRGPGRLVQNGFPAVLNPPRPVHVRDRLARIHDLRVRSRADMQSSPLAGRLPAAGQAPAIAADTETRARNAWRLARQPSDPVRDVADVIRDTLRYLPPRARHHR